MNVSVVDLSKMAFFVAPLAQLVLGRAYRVLACVASLSTAEAGHLLRLPTLSPLPRFEHIDVGLRTSESHGVQGSSFTSDQEVDDIVQRHSLPS